MRYGIAFMKMGPSQHKLANNGCWNSLIRNRFLFSYLRWSLTNCRMAVKKRKPNSRWRCKRDVEWHREPNLIMYHVNMLVPGVRHVQIVTALNASRSIWCKATRHEIYRAQQTLYTTTNLAPTKLYPAITVRRTQQQQFRFQTPLRTPLAMMAALRA